MNFELFQDDYFVNSRRESARCDFCQTYIELLSYATRIFIVLPAAVDRLLFDCSDAIGPPEDAPLKLVQTFSLSSEVKGHFDHLAIDLAGSRLFLKISGQY